MRKLTITAALLLTAGCAAHGAVPLDETSGYAPETVGQMLAHKVVVQRVGTKGWIGARYFRPDGGSDYCGIKPPNRARSSRGTWTVGADSRGRATFRLQVGSRSGVYVPHYDPGSGELKFRRRDGRGGWETRIFGWLQDSWPVVMAERCPGLAAGVPVDERQTAMTLVELRRQAPDAPLKNLAHPLPKPGAKRSDAPASRALAKTPPLTEKDRAGLVAMGVPERYLPAFEDRLVTPAAWARLVEKGFTPAKVAELAAQDTASRARSAELEVVSAGDGVARLRSWMGHWDVREGERVSDIGRVSRITPGGAVWLQGMAEPLPGAAR